VIEGEKKTGLGEKKFKPQATDSQLNIRNMTSINLLPWLRQGGGGMRAPGSAEGPFPEEELGHYLGQEERAFVFETFSNAKQKAFNGLWVGLMMPVLTLCGVPVILAETLELSLVYVIMAAVLGGIPFVAVVIVTYTQMTKRIKKGLEAEKEAVEEINAALNEKGLQFSINAKGQPEMRVSHKVYVGEEPLSSVPLELEVDLQVHSEKVSDKYNILFESFGPTRDEWEYLGK
jgi:hypothetical protein